MILVWLRAVFTSFAALWLTSCVMHKYPEEWAPLSTIEAGACPDIAGAFRDVGTGTIGGSGCGEGGICRLSSHLFAGKTGGSHVRIEQYGDSLVEVQLLRGDQLAEKRFVSAAKGEFACTADGLEIKTSDNAYHMHSAMRTIFKRSEDRSLIARLERSAAGVTGVPPLPILIPVVSHDSHWIKWEPVSEPASGAALRSGVIQTAQTSPDNADNPEPASFYKGTTLKLSLGFLFNTEFDKYSRWLSVHFRKHIPGSPNISVENIPGAGTLIAAGYVMAKAAPDGRTMAVFAGDPALWQAAGGSLKNLDWQKFEWIGGIESMANKQRAFFGMSPAVPKERLDHLRGAFENMARDPVFLSEALVKPLTAEEVKAIVAAYYKIR